MERKTIRQLEKNGYRKDAPILAAGASGLPPVHPGVSIYEDVVKASDITVTAFAERLHISRRTVSELLHGKGNITANIALRLQAVTGIDAAQWMRLQMAYDLRLAQQVFAKKKLKFDPLPSAA